MDARPESFPGNDYGSPRPRRLRTHGSIRRLVSQTRLHPSDLILPLFVADGLSSPREISSMPGVFQHTLSSLVDIVGTSVQLGVGGVILFGVPLPEDKDATGSAGWAEEGILNRAIAHLAQHFGDDIVLIADTCLDEFTDHGHCGIVTPTGAVDNDATVELYARMAASQAQAGAHVVAPSGMMDGQVGAIRAALDAQGFHDTAIMAYTAKYASAFYGPFREAVASSLQGDRKTYQQDVANRREALRELELDLAEGADMVMVKPAMSFLDVLSDVAAVSPVPVAAYQVSGEYSMICAAGEKGWINREAIMLETVLSIKRAGADVVLTYSANEIAGLLA